MIQAETLHMSFGFTLRWHFLFFVLPNTAYNPTIILTSRVHSKLIAIQLKPFKFRPCHTFFPSEQQKPPRFVETAKPVQADEGGQAVFKMKIEGEPKPTVTWSKGWKQITDGGRYVVTYDDELDEAVLAIEELVPTDAGKYTCKLSSGLGEEKATVSMVVVQKPKEKETPFKLQK